jgi:hypothetical protein
MNSRRSILRILAALPFVATVVACSETKIDPVKTAQKYEGKIVTQPPAGRGKEDGWYLVKGGKRRWIIDSAWLKKNGYDVKDVLTISSAEFKAIPEDPEPLR